MGILTKGRLLINYAPRFRTMNEAPPCEDHGKEEVSRDTSKDRSNGGRGRGSSGRVEGFI